MADARVVFEAILDHTKFDKDVDELKDEVSNSGWEEFGRKAKSALGKVGSTIVGVGKVANTVVGAISTALGGIALSGGFDRAMNIEQAEAKLVGLGHSTDEVAAIMDDALGSVKGTAYGLGDAASAAANLSASGIQAGKDVGQLEGVLSTVASTAAVSGRDFNEVASVFGKVAATGHLTGETLQQLQDSGVPVLSLLAEHYGTTAEAASEMVSEGEVDFQTFNAVMHESMGSAAAEMGGTFQGQLDNTKAALSRFGASAITPFTEAFKTIAPSLQDAIDAVASALQPLIDDLSGPLSQAAQAAAGALESFTEWLNASPPAVQKAVAGVAAFVMAFSSVTGVIGPVLGRLGQLASIIPSVGAAGEAGAGGVGLLGRAMGALSGPAGIVLAVIAAVAAAVIYLWNTNDEFRAHVTAALESVRESVSELWGMAQPVIMGAVGAVQQLWSVAGPVLQQLGGVLLDVVAVAVEAVADAVAALFGWLASVDWGSIASAVMGVFSPLVESVRSGISDMLTAAQNAVATLTPAIDVVRGALTMLAPVFEGLMTIIGGFVDLLVSALLPQLKAAATVVTTVFGTAFQVAAAVVSAAMQVIAGIVTTVVGVIETIVGVFVGVFTGDWSMASEGASTAMRGMAGIVTGILNGLLSTVSAIVNGIANVFSSVLNGITGTVAGIFGSVSSTIGNLMGDAKSNVSGALDSIAGFFRNLKIEWPHINLPHFTVSGSFNLDPANFSVPSIGIEWYAKGGIFNGPSIAGLGEAGPEAAMPLQGRNMWPFADAVAARLEAALGGMASRGEVNQTINFNQPIKSPDQVAREMRMYETYGIGAMA
jgi:tape measure domain-containing protein